MKVKYNLPVITAEIYHLTPERYELRSGLLSDAPLCPYGHRFKWLGYDLEGERYVRLTKSVFKRLIRSMDPGEVKRNEDQFDLL